MHIDFDELENFLRVANQNTYAHKNAPKAASLRPASEDYHFEQGNLVYHDTYFGGWDFMGEEIVYKKQEPVWGMNYYGFILKKDVSENEIYDLLREALMQEYGDILPVRGPKEYVTSNGKYQNMLAGKLDRFSGTEEIFLNGEFVYRCWYHGGFIQ